MYYRWTATQRRLTTLHWRLWTNWNVQRPVCRAQAATHCNWCRKTQTLTTRWLACRWPSFGVKSGLEGSWRLSVALHKILESVQSWFDSKDLFTPWPKIPRQKILAACSQFNQLNDVNVLALSVVSNVDQSTIADRKQCGGRYVKKSVFIQVFIQIINNRCIAPYLLGPSLLSLGQGAYPGPIWKLALLQCYPLLIPNSSTWTDVHSFQCTFLYPYECDTYINEWWCPSWGLTPGAFSFSL